MAATLALLAAGPVPMRVLRRKLGQNCRRTITALRRRGAVREVLVGGLPSVALHEPAISEGIPASVPLDPAANHGATRYNARMSDGITIRLPDGALERASAAAERLSSITPITKSAILRAAVLKGLAAIEGEIGESPVDTLRRLARERIAERNPPKDAA